MLPDFVVADLDTTDTIYAAVTRDPALGVPASIQRGWRARFRRNERILVSASSATTIALGGDMPSSWWLDDTLVRLWLAGQCKTDCSLPSADIKHHLRQHMDARA